MNAVDVRLVLRAAKPVLPCGQHKHYHPEHLRLQQQKTAGQDSQSSAILASGQRAGNRILSKNIVLIAARTRLPVRQHRANSLRNASNEKGTDPAATHPQRHTCPLAQHTEHPLKPDTQSGWKYAGQMGY